LTINLLGELPFQFGDSLLEHLAMNGGCGGGELAPGARQRQLDRAPLRRAFALRRRQGTSWSALALGFRLLKLDVFALESSGHGLMTGD
jgi:hypothetical protein